MKKVAPLRYDVIFKKAFTQPDIFMAFVKDILGIDIKIDHVETEKRFDPPIGSVACKFDLFAEDVEQRIIVDLQHVRMGDHYDRFLHYHCTALLEQANNAKNYRPERDVYTVVILTSDSHPTYPVGIIDFDPKTPDGKSFKVLSHKVVFLCSRHVDDTTPKNYAQWLQAIDDSQDGEVDDSVYDHPAIRRVFDLIGNDQVSPEERAVMKDEYGYEQIGKEYFEKGEQSKSLVIAERLLAQNLPLDAIMQATDLSIEQIRDLQQKHS